MYKTGLEYVAGQNNDIIKLIVSNKHSHTQVQNNDYAWLA